MTDERLGVVEDAALEQSSTEDLADPQGADSGAQEVSGSQSGATEEKIPDSVWATARKRAEKEVGERMQARIDKFYANTYSGYNHPVTGKPIASEADYLELEKYMREQERDSQLSSAGITKDTLREIFGQMPEMQAFREMQRIQEAKIQKDALDYCLGEISKIDPSIKSFDDLGKMETVGKFEALVKKGYSLKDAFVIANFDSLQGRTADNTKQDTLKRVASNNAASPGSLTSTVQEKPLDFDGMSDDEFEKYYQKALRGELMKS